MSDQVKPVDLSRHEGHTPNWRAKTAELDGVSATLIEGHGPSGDVEVALFSDPETPEERANEALLLDAPALRREVIAWREGAKEVRSILRDAAELFSSELYDEGADYADRALAALDALLPEVE